ncbi:MAG: restriction endonuclease subunit S [Chromatiaceae bacterium]
MAGEWAKTTLGEVADKNGYGLVDGPFGSNLPAACYTEEGIPVIRGSNLTLGTGRFRADEFVFVSEATAKRLERSLCRPLDIVFTKKGTLGQTGLVPEGGKYDLYLLSSNQMKLTVDCRSADPLFVYYFVSSPESTAKIIRDSEATGVPKTNVAYLRDFPISLPPLPEQRAIAHILGTLDDKIELNRRMNETLETMARALFKSWFVDFDPVRAKAEGRSAGLPRPLADLFPSCLLDSELGEIPEGWGIKPVGDLADVVGGTTPSTKEASYWAGGTHAWATPKDLSGLPVPVLLDTERRITDAGLSQVGSGLLPKGTVLLSSRAPIGYLAVAELPVAINQGFIAMVAKADTSNLFLLLWASVAHEDIVSRANGSTFLEISKANFRPIPVVTPPAQVMLAFEEQARPLYQRIVASARESQSLAALRDSLLPKLISGELRVRRA